MKVRARKRDRVNKRAWAVRDLQGLFKRSQFFSKAITKSSLFTVQRGTLLC